MRHVAEFSPFQVSGNSVIARSLDVHRSEIEGDRVSGVEELLGEFEVEILFGELELRCGREHSPEERIDATLVDESPGREEGVSQAERSLRNAAEGLVQTVQLRLDERVSEAQSGCGEDV